MKPFLHQRALLNVLHQFNTGRQICTSPISQTLLQQEINYKYRHTCENVNTFKVDLKTVRNLSSIRPKDQRTHKTLLSDKITDTRHNDSIGKKPIAQGFMENIDFDQLKKELLEKKNKSNNKDFQLNDKISEIIQEKCDEAIAALDKKDSDALKVIQLEYDFLYSEGYRIQPPEEMTSENWLEALNMSSKMKRLKYYIFVSKRATKKANQVRKKRPGWEGVPMNSYPHGRIFLRIYESTINRSYDYKLANAAVHGVPLILDFDFAQHMRGQDMRNTGKQLRDVYTANRKHATPFHLHYTNCSNDNPIYKAYQMMRMSEKHIDFASVTPKSYLDVFDKDRLVYLSPDGRNTLHKFDPDDIFIVGAFNDKANPLPLTYAKAKQQNIRCAKLPLDDFAGRLTKKVLSLDVMMKILLTFYETKSWEKAFQHIPSRFRIDDESPHHPRSRTISRPRISSRFR